MKKISVLTPTYNEEENIVMLCKKIKDEFKGLNYDYEHVVIDNNSSDNTISIIKKLCQNDKNLKLIVNNKNYGHLNSPYYGLMQTSGHATILMASDFQDPPELISKYIELWEKGHKVILAQKNQSDENFLIKNVRKFYYKFLSKISDTNLTINTTGAGLFDKSIIDLLKKIEDPIPYLRGLVCELEGDIKLLKFDQPKRILGKTKNNFFSLIDVGLLGLVKHSKIPLRLMVIFGMLASIVSILVSIVFLFYKLFYWDSFDLGVAPIIVGLFFISAIQIFLLGLLGEYISVLLSHTRKLPLVIEKERINFEDKN
jgi:polyisoprenyl-phosphate glycosyltransferase